MRVNVVFPDFSDRGLSTDIEGFASDISDLDFLLVSIESRFVLNKSVVGQTSKKGCFASIVKAEKQDACLSLLKVAEQVKERLEEVD